jgi:hypothetical protein
VRSKIHRRFSSRSVAYMARRISIP